MFGCPRRFLAILAAGVLCLGVGFGSLAQQPGGTLTIGFGTELDTLDTFRSALAAPLKILGLVCDTLFAFDNALQPQPVLVDSWEQAEDGLRWTFHLKEGISFHDGTPFNAQQLKDYLWGFFIDQSFTGWMFAAIEDMVVTGEYTIDFILSEPAPLLLFNLAYPWNIIQPKGAYDEFGDEYGFTALVGTGPFAFEEWIQGDRIVLSRNEDYAHGPAFVKNTGPAYLESIVFRILPEPATLVNELRSGNVDYAQVPTTHLEAVMADDAITVISRASYYSQFLEFNLDRPITNDWRLRNAVNHAIDREALINAAWFGAATTSYGLVAPASFGYWPGIVGFGKEFLTYNPEVSVQLLEQSGWTLPAGSTVREKDGERLAVKLVTTNSPTYQTLGEATKAMLEEVGFEVELYTFELASYYSVALEGDWDLMHMAWIDESGYSVVKSKASIAGIESGTNDARYRDAALDSLITLAMTTTDDTTRDQAMAAVQQKIVADLVYIPMTVPLSYVAAKTERVGGMQDLALHPWWLDLMLALDLYIK